MKTRKMIYLCLLISICVVFGACGKTESEGTKEDLEKQETFVEEKTEDEIDEQKETSKKENANKPEGNSSNSQSSTETNVPDNNTQNTTTNTEKDKTNNQTNTNSNSNTTSNKPSEQKHSHTYAKATCTKPQTCSCGATKGSALGHNYSKATCTSPQTCSACGNKKGSALGHTYANATCTTPKKCACGATSGNALGHSYNTEGVCSRCSTKDPNFKYPTLASKGGRWTCIYKGGIGNGVNEITLIDFYFNGKVKMNICFSNGIPCPTGDCCDEERWCVTLNGEHHEFGAGYDTQEGYSFVETDNTITIYDKDNRAIKLQRITTNTTKVISIDTNFEWEGDCNPQIPIGTILTFENVNN